MWIVETQNFKPVNQDSDSIQNQHYQANILKNHRKVKHVCHRFMCPIGTCKRELTTKYESYLLENDAFATEKAMSQEIKRLRRENAKLVTLANHGRITE